MISDFFKGVTTHPCTTFVLWCVTTQESSVMTHPCITFILWCVTTQESSVMTHPCITFILWCITTQESSVMTERRHPRRPVATLDVRHDAPMVRHDARLAVCQFCLIPSSFFIVSKMIDHETLSRSFLDTLSHPMTDL